MLRIVYFLIFKCSKCTCMTTKNLKDQFQWHGHYKPSVFKARWKGDDRAALQYCVSFSSFACLACKSNFKICIEFTQNCDHCWLLSLLSLLLTYRTLLSFFFTIRKSKDPINIQSLEYITPGLQRTSLNSLYFIYKKSSPWVITSRRPCSES